MYGPTDEAESIATIHAALDARRHPARHRRLLRHGPQRDAASAGRSTGRRDKVLLSVKFGALRGPDGAWLGFDARPAAVKNFARLQPEAPRRRPHRHLPPGAARSRACRSRTRSARSPTWSRPATSATSASPRSAPRRSAARTPCIPIVDLQIEYSLVSRGPEAAIFPVARASSASASRPTACCRAACSAAAARPARATSAPTCRASPDANRETNRRLVEALAEFAAAKGVKPVQLAIAWALRKGPDIVPVIGARTRAQLADALAALSVALSPGDVARLEAILDPALVAGSRYDESQMRVLDSER